MESHCWLIKEVMVRQVGHHVPFSPRFSAGEKELVVLGDFSAPPQSSELDILRKEKLFALVPSTQFTNISTRSPQGSRCLDNIWLSRSLKKIYSGKCNAKLTGVSSQSIKTKCPGLFLEKFKSSPG